MRSRISSLVRCVGVLPDGGTDFLSSFKSIVPFPHCFGPHWESALAQILVFQFHAFRGRLSELRADDLARGIYVRISSNKLWHLSSCKAALPYEIPLECGQDSAVIPIIIVWAAFVNTFRRVCGGISVICKFFYRFVFFAEKQEKMAVLRTLRSDGVCSQETALE